MIKSCVILWITMALTDYNCYACMIILPKMMWCFYCRIYKISLWMTRACCLGCICMKYACVHVHIQNSCGCAVILVIWTCNWTVFVNAWPTRANRKACDSTECQSEDEQEKKPVAERRRSSLSELGSKLTSLILPKTLVQPKPTSSLLQHLYLPAKGIAV